MHGGWGLPLTQSSAEFRDLCLKAPGQSETGSASVSPKAEWLLGIPFEDRKHSMVRARWRKPTPDGDTFFEVPPAALNQDIETVIPRTGSAEVLQYKEEATVLRVYNTLGWIDVARQGVAHACEHSKRLIVDVRGNNGGGDTVIEWLHRHLFPGIDDPVQAGKLAMRVRNDNEAFNEALFNMAALDALLVPRGVKPCSVGIGPACIVDVNTGGFLPLNELAWFRRPKTVERRGGVPVSLSRQAGIPPENLPESFDAASCAGRFVGHDLIFLTDGSNASGGYFLPAAFKGEAVLVTMGGLVDEPMAMGRARGGCTEAGSAWASLAKTIPDGFGRRHHVQTRLCRTSSRRQYEYGDVRSIPQRPKDAPYRGSG